jgi:hypothetical protein
VKGIVGDANITGHFSFLQALLIADEWRDLWNSLGLRCFIFAEMGLAPDAPDALVWEVCQREDVALLTDNRNEEDADSLEQPFALSTRRSAFQYLRCPMPRNFCGAKCMLIRSLNDYWIICSKLTTIADLFDCTCRNIAAWRNAGFDIES